MLKSVDVVSSCLLVETRFGFFSCLMCLHRRIIGSDVDGRLAEKSSDMQLVSGSFSSVPLPS